MTIRAIWERFAVYAGIFSFIVDFITLWTYLGIRIQVRSAPTFTSMVIPREYRLLFVGSLALIIFGVCVLLLYLPRQSGFWRSLESVSSYDVTYGAGIDTVLIILAAAAPAVLIWLRVFVNVPPDASLYLVLLTALVVHALLLLLTGFEAVVDHVNIPLVLVGAVLVVYVVAYALTNWPLDYALAIASLIVACLAVYDLVLIKSPHMILYRVTRKL